MSKLVSSLYLFVLLLSISGLAQTTDAEPSDADETKQANYEQGERAAYERERSYSSGENREDKSFQIDISALGYSYGFDMNGALSLYKFLDRDSLLGLSVISQEDEDNGIWEHKGTTVEFSYKHFEGNTFYVQPTLFYRNFKSADRISSLFVEGRRGVMEIEDLGIGLKIGNQWQWSRLTLGCDWFGVGRRIATLSEEKLDEYDSDVDEDTEFSFVILNFYVGMSF